MPAANKFLSIKEASNFLGVSSKTLRRWEDKGLIKSIRTSGGHRRYTALSLRELKTSNKTLKTIREAAYFLGVSTKTLRRWEKKGLIKPIRTPGGHRRYNVSSLNEFKQSSKKVGHKLPGLHFSHQWHDSYNIARCS